ncbi:MAG: hypothetical protein R8P61_35730 [Bacteroidia bacterium]|nr:hypothetical protein [Bacteroidia bacterium]
MIAYYYRTISYCLLLFSMLISSSCSSTYYREILHTRDFSHKDWKQHLQESIADASIIIVKDQNLLLSHYGTSGLYRLGNISFEEEGLKGVLLSAPPYMHGSLPERNRISAYSIPTRERDLVFNSLRIHLNVELSGDEEIILYRNMILTESFDRQGSSYSGFRRTGDTNKNTAASLISLLLFILLF